MEDERLAIRKIVVDSRTATQGTGSDFKVQLPETITLPKHFGCYVTDIQCVHSFRSVHGNTSVGARNHYFYFFERMVSAFHPSENDFTILNRAVLSPGSYTPTELCAELQSQMNAVSFFGSSAYTVSYSSSLHNATISLSAAGDSTYPNYHGFIPVSGNVLQDSTLSAYAATKTLINTSGNAYPLGATQIAYSFNTGNLEDAGGLFSLDTHVDNGFRAAELMATINNSGTSTQWPKTYTTNEVDVRNIHTLYLHSNALSNFSAIGPAGSRSVIARLPVTGLSGSVLFKQHSGNPHDIIDCSGKMLRVLDFSIRNSQNQIVDLHGGSLSFELVFAPLPTN
jgi:hypothetical protein